MRTGPPEKGAVKRVKAKGHDAPQLVLSVKSVDSFLHTAPHSESTGDFIPIMMRAGEGKEEGLFWRGRILLQKKFKENHLFVGLQ